MKRYDKRKLRNREEVDARLSALRRSRPKPSRKRRSNAGPAVLGLLLVAGVLGAVYFIYATATRGEDEQAPNGPVNVEVVKGDTLESVSRKLEEAGVIDSAFMFETEARMEGYSTEIQAGEYTFKRGEDSDEILAKLTAGAVVPTIAITIPEGLTLEETAQTVAEQSSVSAAGFEAAARKTDYGYAFLEDPAIKSTEGFLFPAKYEFERGVTASQIVNRLLEQYLLETQTLDIAGAKERLNLTEYELVTVASLIEREAASAKERPLVASVIYNRLRDDMPLQIDASIHYALDKPKEELSLADLRIDSPYNTYEHTGLPPGPICSPSRQSLEAAIEPAETDYLYYVLKANGEEHFFTDNYSEFLAAKQKRDASLTVSH